MLGSQPNLTTSLYKETEAKRSHQENQQMAGTALVPRIPVQQPAHSSVCRDMLIPSSRESTSIPPPGGSSAAVRNSSSTHPGREVILLLVQVQDPATPLHPRPGLSTARLPLSQARDSLNLMDVRIARGVWTGLTVRTSHKLPGL